MSAPTPSPVAVHDPGQLIPLVRRTALVRCNPLTKIAVALILMVGTLLSIDVVSAGVVLGFCLFALPATGLDLRAALKRLWFLPLGALLAAWGTAILAEKTGEVVIDVGPILMTTGSLEAATAIFLRALALAIPLIVLASTIDPRDLADALVQRLRLPEVVVVSVLAASRLLGLLVSEWQTLAMARRARGIAGGSIVRRTRSLFAGIFVLLVQSIRRGTTLAMAMEGRAFGRPGRTWRRASTFGSDDRLAVVVSLAVCALAIVAAHMLGTWNPIVGGN
ncbi:MULTISPECIES: energy-coupling factor transporter transmembrane component T family protein [Brevibacterium]|uniref:Cobalt transporter n=1 Tax=Brevibacterium aurantiacum TaxID=273384 RepID=A0A2A3Z498_BREAU|nr:MULTISPECIES: energy-coupling factor transporter transmembrane component T [Brevibacterium]PCC46337.1 cobalt transporter [Brevibacterium aurantiacum]SMX76841.1 energy-coupling factor transport system permease protein [Brevibacterium sp. 239c]SMX87564.1 energy-coupling factor transport system permease protein [Brevibacterium aurantiacum]